jgi:hypothetical protein
VIKRAVPTPRANAGAGSKTATPAAPPARLTPEEVLPLEDTGTFGSC